MNAQITMRNITLITIICTRLYTSQVPLSSDNQQSQIPFSRRTSSQSTVNNIDSRPHQPSISNPPPSDMLIDEDPRQHELLEEESRVRYPLYYSCAAIAGGLIELATGAMTLAYQNQLPDCSSLFSPGGWHTPVASVVLTGSLLASCYQFAPRRCYQKIISAKKMEYLPLLASKTALCMVTNTAPLAYLVALLTEGNVGHAGSVLTIGGTMASVLGILGQYGAQRLLRR